MYTKRLLKLKQEEPKPDLIADDLKLVSTKLDDSIEEETPQRQIIEEEVIEVGSVSWQTYKRFYSYAPCGLWGMVFVVFMHIVINLCNLAVSLYLAFTLTERFVADQNHPFDDHKYNLQLSLIIIGALLSSFIGKYISNYIFMKINHKVHNEMVRSVLHAQIRFFEENTQGRIINRFSKDISTLDNLVFTVLEMIDYVVKCFMSLALVIWIVPWLLIVVGLSLVYLLRLRKKSIYVSRDCMRLKSTLTSPINSLIQDAVNGLPTLRCMGKKDFFMGLLFKLTDKQQRSFITSSGGNRWTAIRIDF